MAWSTDLVLSLRYLINDINSETYSDDRLKRIIVVASYFVVDEANLERTYAINVDLETIDPDPTLDPVDRDFNSLILLKAACLLDRATFRTQASRSGVSVTIGDASITRTTSESHKDLLRLGPCQSYSNAIFAYNLGKTDSFRAILSPFSGPGALKGFKSSLFF